MRFFHVQSALGKMEPSGALPSDREALTNTIQIAWPSILESFLISLVGVIDTMMVGVLGSSAIAAVGLTTQPKFIGLAVFMSLNVAVSAIVAHRLGQQDKQSANKVLVQALTIALGLTAVISVLCVAFAEPIIAFAGGNEDTLRDGADYFKIIMGGMIFNVVSMTINAAQRGSGNTKIAMRTNIVSNLVNVGFNYLLIGGNFGFPAMGVRGAAVATVIGSVVACGMSIVSLLHKDRFISLRKFPGLGFDRRTLASIANIGSSSLVEQVFLRIGFFTYSILVAKLGTADFAAHMVGMNILSISFSLGDGLSVASVALVGRSLGEKRRDLARMYGGFCQRIGLSFAAVLAVVFLICGKQIFMLFSREADVLQHAEMIIGMIILILFTQIPQVVFSGSLRGSGDTKFTALVSLISVAVVRPGAGWLFCYPLHLGLFGAWIGLAADQIVRLVLTWWRFRSGKWMWHKV